MTYREVKREARGLVAALIRAETETGCGDLWGELEYEDEALRDRYHRAFYEIATEVER